MSLSNPSLFDFFAPRSLIEEGLKSSIASYFRRERVQYIGRYCMHGRNSELVQESPNNIHHITSLIVTSQTVANEFESAVTSN